MRPGAKWSGCAAPGLGVREDTDLTREQKVIRAKVSLLELARQLLMVAGMNARPALIPDLEQKVTAENDRSEVA